MAVVKSVPKKHHVHLSYIPRRLLSDKEEGKPTSSEEQSYATVNTNAPVLQSLLSVPSLPILQPVIKDQLEAQDIEDDTSEIKNTRPLTSKNNEVPVVRNKNLNNLSSTEQIDHDDSGCFQKLSAKQKTLCKIIIAILIIVGVVSAGVLPAVLLLVLRETDSISTTSTTTLSPCSSTTCIGKETPYHTSIVTVLYPFDGNTNDSTGRFSGIPFNSPTYVIQSYVGSRALLLNNPSAAQCIQIPYVDLSKQSFTIQTWLYVIISSTSSDYGIFSLCDNNSTCLSISLRNGRFTLSFDSMNINNNTLVSATFVPTREWVHLTVVYDAVLYQQQIYVNGRIDSISTGMTAPYQRTSSNSTAAIGASKSFAYGWTFFQGRIDQFTISAGTARTACQVLNDATLTVYFPFNTIDPFNDYSANLFTGIASNTTLMPGGYIEQAIYFTSNMSYFQVQSFPEVRNVSNANPPFTFSLWVNPVASTNGGSVIHISSLANGNGSICFDLLALTNTGALVVQLMGSSSSVVGLQGPVLPNNTWTHVGIIYSQEDGARLFINAQMKATYSLSNIPYYMARWDTPLYITLGTNSPLTSSAPAGCLFGTIPFVSGSYIGAIDDFRLYSRELDNEELCVLANL